MSGLDGAGDIVDLHGVSNIFPAHAEILLELSQYSKLTGHEELEAQFRRAAALEVEPGAIASYLATQAAKDEDVASVEKRLAAHNREALSILVEVAAQRRALGARAEASTLSELASKLAPHDSWRSLDFALDLRALGRAEEALMVCQRIIEADANNVHALRLLGELARSRGDRAEALKRSRAAVAAAPTDYWRWLDLSGDLQALGQKEEAEQALQNIISFDPANVQALRRLGAAAMNRNDHGKALNAFATAAVLHPSEAWRWLDLAKVLAALGQTEGEEEAYARALQAEPDQFQALLGLGRCARARGAHEEALASFSRAAELVPKDMWRWLDVGDELQALSRFDDAEAAFRRAIETAPNSMEAVLRLVNCARQRGAHEVALEALARATQLAPKDIWRWLDLGDEFTTVKRLSEAEDAYRHAMVVAPGNTLAVQRLAGCIRARSGISELVTFYQKYTALHPNTPWAELQLAACLRDIDCIDDAKRVCLKLLDRTPDNASALWELGLCARAGNDYDIAITSLRAAAKLKPDELWLNLDIIKALSACGMHDDALAEAEFALAQHPGQVAARLAHAQCLRDCGRHEESLSAYVRAAKAFPLASDIRVELAEQYRRLGRHDQAEAELERVLEHDPANVEAVTNLGRTALLLGDILEARRLFSAGAAAKPDEMIFQMGVIDSLAAGGEIDEAIKHLEALENQQGLQASLRVKRTALLRQTGRLHEAVAVARESTKLLPANFWLWFERFFCEMLVGPGSEVETCLNMMPVPAVREFGMRQRCRGLYAESRLMFGTALHYYADAARLLPEDTAPLNDLSRANFLTMHLDASLAHLRKGGALEAHNNKLLGRSLNVSQTHYGQILDEFRMDREASTAAAALWTKPPRQRLTTLRTLVEESPDNTALAVCLLLSLRQTGPLTGAPNSAGASIPRVIHQFWDSNDIPPDIELLMKTWADQNKEWEVRLYDDRAAHELLTKHFPKHILAAFRRCREPAQRADLFRLAVLALTGGVYADSDDRCLIPLDEFLPANAQIVLYQEDLGTIGNNFIAAQPQSPVITSALERAAEAINRGDTDIVWLATGPGLLSRVVAEWLAHDIMMPAGLVIFDRREIFQAVGMHCATGYKRQGRHWLETSFARRAANEKRSTESYIPLSTNVCERRH